MGRVVVFQFVLQMEAMAYWKWCCLGESVADDDSGEKWSCPGANLVFCSERPLCFVISSSGREGWVFRGRNPICMRNLLRLSLPSRVRRWRFSPSKAGRMGTPSPPEPSLFPVKCIHLKPCHPQLLLPPRPALPQPGKSLCPKWHSPDDNGQHPGASSPSKGR